MQHSLVSRRGIILSHLVPLHDNALDQGSRRRDRPLQITTALMLFLSAACQNNANEFSDTLAYRDADRIAEHVFSELTVAETSSSFQKKVAAGFSTSPREYISVVMSSVSDGDYVFGNRIYRNVSASLQNAKKFEKNLAAFAYRFSNLKDMFEHQKVNVDGRLSEADLKQYFRFTVDSLENHGLAGDMRVLKKKYSDNNLMKIMHTAIYVTQLPSVIQFYGSKSFALAEPINQQSIGGYGGGMAAAAKGEVVVVTGRDMKWKEPFQCGLNSDPKYLYKDSDDNEYLNGIPIAGVDGGTFGATKDGVNGSGCGKCYMIKNKKVIVLDRIWENNGTGQRHYGSSDKAGADSGGQGDAPGFKQFDVAKKFFEEELGGQTQFFNPGDIYETGC